MKQRVSELPEEKLLRSHPISDVIPGWYFRVEEVSNCAWLAEGLDKWGRKVSCTGYDDKETLNKCAKMAEEINSQISEARPE